MVKYDSLQSFREQRRRALHYSLCLLISGLCLHNHGHDFMKPQMNSVDGASWSRLDLDIERSDRGQPVFWPTASRLRSCCCETFTFSNNLNLLSSLSGQTSDVLTYWRSWTPLRSSAILVELSAKTAVNEDWNENYNQSGGTKEIQGFGCPSGFNQVEVEATSNQPDTA